MNTIYNFFSTDWAYALGWTLMHSIWQSLIIFVILLVCLHFISPMLSKLRYALTCGALILTLLSGTITFLYSINHSVSHSTLVRNAPSGKILSLETEKAKTTVQQIFDWAYQGLNENMPLIITAWVIGFLIFAMRLFNGFMYTYQLRISVTPLHNQWTVYIGSLSKKMGITKAILFAESRQITTPMVIGYVKPVILVPVGMLTGLSAEQLETIIIHELAHIKRHDFLINVIQSIVETAFFFNPFVWSISALIRREREFCCDDIVMQQHGGSRAYANALAQLEEARLSKSLFALSLAENKNELLNRIRRIMEKSLKNHSGKGRIMLPVVLLIAGLLCVSWLSIEQETNYADESLAVQDTTVRKNNKPTKYSRKSIITIDENGQPHEEIVEEFEGDENLRPMIEMELAPDVQFAIPQFPSIDAIPAIPPLDFDVLPDSLPLPRFGFREREEWKEFSKVFEEEFAERFQDFYASHAKDLEAMMKELEEKFKAHEFESFDIPLQDFESINKELEQVERFREQTFEHLKQFDNDEAFKDLQENLDRLHENLEHLQLDNQNRHSHLWDFNIHEKELRKMLIDDGYMSEDESIETLEWNDEVLKINGVKIKEGDRKKYEDILNKRRNLKKIE